MTERRRAKRIKATSLASFFGERRVTAGIIQDLSTTGARVLTEVALQVGETVEVKVDLPENRGAFRVVARVVWLRASENQFHPHLMGLEFVTVDESERAKLIEFAAEY